ncbi:MAG: hypothetical protein ACKO8I_13595, partial [Cyanobacteriota bacterium]
RRVLKKALSRTKVDRCSATNASNPTISDVKAIASRDGIQRKNGKLIGISCIDAYKRDVASIDRHKGTWERRGACTLRVLSQTASQLWTHLAELQTQKIDNCKIGLLGKENLINTLSKD